MATCSDKDFAIWIKKHRGIAGLSRQKLAEKLDVHVNTIERWEQGGTVPPHRGTILFFEDIQDKMIVICNQVFADSGLKEKANKKK